jgi:hypothetical protein
MAERAVILVPFREVKERTACRSSTMMMGGPARPRRGRRRWVRIADRHRGVRARADPNTRPAVEPTRIATP